MHLVKSLLVLTSVTPLVAAGPNGNALRRRAADGSKDSSSPSLPATDLNPSSSTSANNQASLTLVGTAPLGTGFSSAPQTTQEVVITDVVYTTLTTCPVTSLVTSGSTSFEEITTTISTITRTSTSTLCTKCVAPPSKPAMYSSSPRESAASSLPTISVLSLSQPSPIIPQQTALSSKPEVPGTAVSPSTSLVFPSSISLTVSATSGASSTLEFPGYAIVPSPVSTPGSPREGIISNATSSIIPVYTAELLGNAYGGGFISTPSIYVTKLPYPNGPSGGVPPGYESQSSVTVVGNNVTATFTGLEASSAPAVGLQSASKLSVPALTATIVSNVSVLLSSFGASTIPGTSSESESSTPTFISLSPFGGEVGQQPNQTAVPVPSSLGSAVIGSEIVVGSSATASVQLGSSGSSVANVITALIAATSPTSVLAAEASQISSAVLASLAAAGVSTSSVNIQVAVVGSSTTSVIGASGETAESSFSTLTPIGGAAILSTAATVSPVGPASSSRQVATAEENAGGLATSATELPGVTGASISPATTVASVVLGPSFSSNGVNGEAGEIGATIIPSLPAEQSAGPLVTLAIGPSPEQILVTSQPTASLPTAVIIAGGSTVPTVVASPVISANSQSVSAGQPVASLPTSVIIAGGSTVPNVVASPVVGAISQTLPAGQPVPSAPTPVIIAGGSTVPTVVASPVVGANSETVSAGQPVASLPTQVILANSSTAIAVVPSPVVGANGLTSLAVFSTPIAPAAGLTTPTVLLTPVVGANGLTSLAVVATPVVGANGLTSLAIGFETETSPAAGQSNTAPTPVEGFVLVQSPAFVTQASRGNAVQGNIAASGVANVFAPSGPAESPASGGNGAGNYSIHVLLNPTAATQFKGSAVRVSLGLSVGFLALMVFFVLL